MFNIADFYTDRARLLAGRALAYEGLSLWREALNDYTTALDLAGLGGWVGKHTVIHAFRTRIAAYEAVFSRIFSSPFLNFLTLRWVMTFSPYHDISDYGIQILARCVLIPSTGRPMPVYISCHDISTINEVLNNYKMYVECMPWHSDRYLQRVLVVLQLQWKFGSVCHQQQR